MLTLPIKRKWFDMIWSGEKKEEYREIKPYYEVRFTNAERRYVNSEWWLYIQLRAGYGKNAPSMIIGATLDTGKGKKEWGATPGVVYFRLHIKEIFRPGDYFIEGNRT